MKTNVVCWFLGASLLLGVARGDSSNERQAALSAAAAGRWQESEAVLERLAGAEPADADACQQLSRLRLLQGRVKDAVNLLTRATTASPNRSDLQSDLGHALARRMGEVSFVQQAMLAGRMQNAYEKAVELDPKNVGGWIGLTQYCINAPAIAGGSLEKAEEYAKEVEKLSPYDGALQLGAVREQAGKSDEALQYYQRATEMNPKNPWPWVCIGRVQAKGGKTDEARKAYTAALERAPGFKPAADALAALDAPKAE